MAKQPSNRDNGGAASDKGNAAGSSTGGAVAAESAGSIPGMFASLFILAVTAIAVLVSKLWHGLTEDGTLKAAFRQGADEVGVALKAFPESISVQEPGTVLNPTQGEIAAERKPAFHSSYYASFSASSAPPHPWPSEVARDHQPRAGRDTGQDQDAGNSL